MTRDDVTRYFADYNAGRYEEAVEHYAEDAVFVMPGDEPNHVGRAAILQWFQERGAGYSETLTPTNILMTPDGMAVELTATYEAAEDLPDFPIKPLKKGETLSREDGAFYDLKDGKITRVCIYVR